MQSYYNHGHNNGYRQIGRPENWGVLEINLRRDYGAQDVGYDDRRLDRVLSEWKECTPSGTFFRLVVGVTMPCTRAPLPFGSRDRVEVVAEDPYVLQAWREFLSGSHSPDGVAVA